MNNKMKAVVYEKYGAPEVLHMVEVEKPVPKENEVLIKIYSTTVSAADWRARSLIIPYGFKHISHLVFGVSKPRQPILGMELAGEVESIGKGVTKYKAGDKVFAATGITMGCYAQYKCMPEDGAVALKPDNLSFDEAAALTFGGITALHFFRKAKLQPGEKVLINGASGAVGTAALQLARHFGADITAICSGPNTELVKSLGANHVIDYTKEDFTKNGETYDVIMDNVGTAPFSRSKNSLTKQGRFLLILGTLLNLLQIPIVSLTSSKKIFGGSASTSVEDLQFLAELAENGEFRPFIDRRYPLEEIVEAHRYVDTGRKRGNVIITVKKEK
ncbi:MAG: NAD(P)-dependent alcohol dehydrogenase [Leptospirales bacterium]